MKLPMRSARHGASALLAVLIWSTAPALTINRDDPLELLCPVALNEVNYLQRMLRQEPLIEPIIFPVRIPEGFTTTAVSRFLRTTFYENCLGE